MNRLLQIFLGLLMSGQVFAQSTQSPSQLLQQFSVNHLQEKIYAHLDQSSHLTGEILWFNLYTVDATEHRLLDLSKVAYVEILDRNNQPVLQTKVALESGLGGGSLYLPSTLNTGPYLFRAYTNWMKNQGSEFFFQKPVSIINTLKSGEASPRVSSTNQSIQFFPEGGQLIENLANRVAFKVFDNTGASLAGKGILLNQKNDTLAKFEALKFGMGRFEFTPMQNNSYRVEFSDAHSKKIQGKLPDAVISGYCMMLDHAENKIKISVRSPQKHFESTLVAHTRQSVKLVQNRNTSDGLIEFFIDPSKLGEGVSHITIFDSENRPVCERLYFKKPVEQNVSVNTNQVEYNIRRKAELAITGKTGNYSLSIFRADSIIDQSTIISNIYLTSDLSGHIEHPEYYFSSAPEVTLAADNLMLTHGWRRFNWANLDQASDPAFLPEVRGHLIQGKIVDPSGNPVANKSGFLAFSGKQVRILTAKSNSSGAIRFQMKSLRTEGKIIAQTDYLKDSLLHLEIENPFFSKYASWIPSMIKLETSAETSLVNRSVGMQVQDIFNEDGTYFNFSSQESDSIPFYGQANEVYKLDDYTRFPVMEEVIREYVRSVWVRKNNKNDYRLRIVNKAKNELFRENPLVLLDGVPVFDINQVMGIDPLKIKRLDVVAQQYYMGPVEFDGIVSYLTYNGDLGGFNLDPRSISLNYDGLQQLREYYSPKYENQASRNSRVPDQRHLLYWNPSIKLQNNKATLLNIFTSDVEGKFYAILEGISNDGAPASMVKSFLVGR